MSWDIPKVPVDEEHVRRFERAGHGSVCKVCAQRWWMRNMGEDEGD